MTMMIATSAITAAFAPNAKKRDRDEIFGVLERNGWSLRSAKGHIVATPPSRTGMKITFPGTPSDSRAGLNQIAFLRKHPECPEELKRPEVIIKKRHKIIAEVPVTAVADPITQPAPFVSFDSAAPAAPPSITALMQLAQSGHATITTKGGFSVRLLDHGGADNPKLVNLPLRYDATIVDDSVVIRPLADSEEGPVVMKRKTAANFGIACFAGPAGKFSALRRDLPSWTTTFTNDGSSLTVKLPSDFFAETAPAQAAAPAKPIQRAEKRPFAKLPASGIASISTKSDKGRSLRVRLRINNKSTSKTVNLPVYYDFKRDGDRLQITVAASTDDAPFVRQLHPTSGLCTVIARAQAVGMRSNLDAVETTFTHDGETLTLIVPAAFLETAPAAIAKAAEAPAAAPPVALAPVAVVSAQAKAAPTDTAAYAGDLASRTKAVLQALAALKAEAKDELNFYVDDAGNVRAKFTL